MLVNGAELLLAFSLITVALRRMADRKRPLEFGPLFGAIALYTVMVAFGFVNGMRRGGDLDIALWEMRGQIYLILVYLLVVNTVDTKQQVARLFWIFMAGVAIKGLVGTWRFLITMEGNLENVQLLTQNSNSILSHEESYLFALFLVLALILFLFRGHRLQVWFAVVAAGPIIIAMLANERRTGMLALLMGILMAVSLTYLFDKGRRRPILIVTVALLFFVPIYVAATWNGTGVVAEPARALRSLVAPDPKDFESNDYRRIEDLDLKYNIQSNPILGHGYGKTINFYIPLPYIGDRFYFWDIIPHNTVLWIWLRLGVFGFSAFWFMIGRSIVASMMVARDLQDPYLKSIGIFVVIALVTWIFTGLVDMGIVGMRETVLIGALMGVVTKIPGMQQNADTEAADDRVTRHSSRPRRIGLPTGR